jgi:hypothetical protein
MDDWCCRSTLGAAADPLAWPASLDQRRNPKIEETSTCSLSLTLAFRLLRLGPARRRGGRGAGVVGILEKELAEVPEGGEPLFLPLAVLGLVALSERPTSIGHIQAFRLPCGRHGRPIPDLHRPAIAGGGDACLSGLYTTAVTKVVCPRRVRSSWPLFASHTFTVWSRLAEAMR